MIFTGFSELNIDSKQRVALPAKFRSQFDLEFQTLLDEERRVRGAPLDPSELDRKARESRIWCVTPTSGRGLILVPLAVFRRLASRREGTLTPSLERVEEDTSLFGLTEQIEQDSAGRLTVPKWQLDQSGLSSEVVMVGSGYRLEVKDRATWMAQLPDRCRRLEPSAAPKSPTSATGGGGAGTTA
jgi:DNA-binding transcriptional regulator/RsmH inhibitor MraZ